MADVLKTFLILAVFLILVVANISNIIRHRKEKKDAKRRKEIGGFTVMKQMKPEDDAETDTGDAPEETGTEEEQG